LNLLAQDIWNQVKNGFAERHGISLNKLWLTHTRPLSFTKGLFVLGVPNNFVREWLEKKYIGDIEKIFVEITGSPVKVMIKIDGYLFRLMKDMQGTGKEGARRQKREEAYDTRYVVRPENRLVYSAFEKILREPPGTFNPLYFYGPKGVGKSHLVYNFLKKVRKLDSFPARYKVNASQFAREFSNAARVGDRVRFRGAVLRSDLLIVENIHELEGKLKVQLELLSILKFLTERSRQVVITSGYHPREIRLLEKPLASFLLSGMVVSISGYSLSSTVLILSDRCRDKGLKVPPTLVETIARSSRGGLKGFIELIEQVLELADLKGESPTPAFLKEHFPEYSTISIGEDAVDRIIELVSKRLDVQRELIASNTKLRKAVLARHLVIYLASSLLQASSSRICRWLGNISPSIVPYAKKKINGLRLKDATFNALVLELQSAVEGGQKFLF